MGALSRVQLLLQDGPPTKFNGKTAADEFQASLFSVTDLSPNSPHTVSIMHADAAGIWLDLDFIIVKVPVGNARLALLQCVQRASAGASP